MQVDVIGISAVANLIRQSNLNKFVINRYGAPVSAAPVFEHLTGTQNKRAVEAFEAWAQNVLNSNPNNTQAYDLLLFNNDDELEADDDANDLPLAKAKRGKAKTNKLRIYFSLANAQGGAYGGIGNAGGDFVKREDIAKVIAETVEKNELIRQNKELSDRLTALENFDDDDDDDDDVNGAPDTLGRVERLFDKLVTFTGHTAAKEPEPAAVGSPEDATTAEQKERIRANIQAAIKRLYKADKELDKDLLKLADIAEKNPNQFNFFMNALRKM